MSNDANKILDGDISDYIPYVVKLLSSLFKALPLLKKSSDSGIQSLVKAIGEKELMDKLAIYQAIEENLDTGIEICIHVDPQDIEELRADLYDGPKCFTVRLGDVIQHATGLRRIDLKK